MSASPSTRRDTCEHLGCVKFKTMYCENDDQVLCDKCAVTFHSNCKIYNVIRPEKSKSALESVNTIVDQALFFVSTYWHNKNKLYLKHELSDFQTKTDELNKLLDIAVCSNDF